MTIGASKPALYTPAVLSNPCYSTVASSIHPGSKDGDTISGIPLQSTDRHRHRPQQHANDFISGTDGSDTEVYMSSVSAVVGNFGTNYILYTFISLATGKRLILKEVLPRTGNPETRWRNCTLSLKANAFGV